MSGRFLIDTNIIIALFAGEVGIREHLKQVEEIFVPCIVLGELYFGAYKSSRISDNLAQINDFALSSAVLSCDMVTAKEYGNIKNMLRAKGRPVPENDIWIAAIANQYKLILVTRDTHFDEINSLRLVRW
ncbi:type II toxin-antitoxin system VapC family toxin [Peptococcaceae bacterium]|nr:type II toxin-antitoxin system VapC family toxin [Peptococcaceae bacterium]